MLINTEALIADIAMFEGTVSTTAQCADKGSHHNSITAHIKHTADHIGVSIEWADTKSELQQRGLVHMGVNMGVPALLKSHNVLSAVETNNTRAIIIAMSDNDWWSHTNDKRASFITLQLCNVVPSDDPVSQLSDLWEDAQLV